MSNTTNEPEIYRTLPDDVSLHTTRVRLEDTDANNLVDMADEVARCVELLATADVDAVAYGCTTGSLVKGPGYDEEIESRIEMEADARSVTTAAAIKCAFDTLGLKSLTITTPCISDRNRHEKEFLKEARYDVVDMTGLGSG